MSVPNELSNQAWRVAAGIGGLYVVTGAMWILGSDAMVASMAGDVADWSAAQRYKGLFYVALTALLLTLLVRVGHQGMMGAVAREQAKDLQVQDLFLRHPQPMWLFDSDTLAFLRVNQAAIHQYGYSEAEFLRMTLADIGPPQEVPHLHTRLAAAGAGYRDLGVLRHGTRDGREIDVRLTGHELKYLGRKAVMMMGIDVTHEQQARRALERQQAQYRQLHESLAEVLWLATPDGGELLYVSPGLESLYGRSLAEFQGDVSLWLQAVHPEDRARALQSQAELEARGMSSCEYRICRPDGSVRWVSDRKRVILDDDGRIAMIGGIAEDISAAKERDAVQQLAQEELERRVQERTAELERVNAELDAFTRTAAHDLRSPLNAVAGFSQLLRMRHSQGLGEDGNRMLSHIENSARQMSGLIADLLSLSRISSVELNLADIDLALLAHEVVCELQLLEPERQVDVQVPQQLPVRCDAGLARALLANLLGNAWKFSGKRAQAHIGLRVAEGADGPVFTVWDDGAGFDASAPQRLFKPFQRFHSMQEFSGTGVGLATCRRIVERHGGRIWLDTAPGAGCRVHFTLAPSTAAEAVRERRAVQACT